MNDNPHYSQNSKNSPFMRVTVTDDTYFHASCPGIINTVLSIPYTVTPVGPEGPLDLGEAASPRLQLQLHVFHLQIQTLHHL